jgi:hypothetical protein
MKNLTVLILVLFISSSVFAQEENMMLMPFKPLMEGTWKANGTWKDGMPFKQEVTFGWGVGGQNVRMNTNSYLDTMGVAFGAFSEGIHAWDNNSNKIRFWTFDVHGNITEGVVQTKAKQIRYVYGNTLADGTEKTMMDAWIWIKDGKYMLKVGVVENDEWTEVLGEFYFWKK